jgi:hypothetical protein
MLGLSSERNLGTTVLVVAYISRASAARCIPQLVMGRSRVQQCYDVWQYYKRCVCCVTSSPVIQLRASLLATCCTQFYINKQGSSIRSMDHDDSSLFDLMMMCLLANRVVHTVRSRDRTSDCGSTLNLFLLLNNKQEGSTLNLFLLLNNKQESRLG